MRISIEAEGVMEMPVMCPWNDDSVCGHPVRTVMLRDLACNYRSGRKHIEPPESCPLVNNPQQCTLRVWRG